MHMVLSLVQGNPKISLCLAILLLSLCLSLCKYIVLGIVQVIVALLTLPHKIAKVWLTLQALKRNYDYLQLDDVILKKSATTEKGDGEADEADIDSS